MWDTLSNFLIFIFWFRIWSDEDRSLYFNPYIAPLGRLSDWALGVIRPAFFGMRSRHIAAVAFLFLAALRGLAVPQQAAWQVRFGFESGLPDCTRVVACLAFSFLSFGVFLFKLWGLSLIYVGRRTSASDHARGALDQFSRPFTDVPAEYRPPLLLAGGMVLVLLLDAVGLNLPGARPGSWPLSPAGMLRAAVSTLAAWTYVLTIIQSLMIVLIIGSLVSGFTASSGLLRLCRDWIDLFLGLLRRHRLVLGMFDLTPILFFFLLRILYRVLIRVLASGYSSLL